MANQKNKKIEKKTSTNMKNEKWHDASRGEHIKRHIARHERVKMMMTCIPRWFIRIIYGLWNGTRMKCRHARSTPEKKKQTHTSTVHSGVNVYASLCVAFYWSNTMPRDVACDGSDSNTRRYISMIHIILVLVDYKRRRDHSRGKQSIAHCQNGSGIIMKS